MNIIDTKIPDVKIIELKVFGDERGFFFESFNQLQFDAAIGRSVNFVQDNHSKSSKGVLRLSLDQILIPCAIRSLAARKPSSLLCRASQPSQRAPQLAIPVRLLSIKPPSLAIAM